MEEILEKAVRRLREEMPELKWVDLNIGQMMMGNPPVDCPCALIDAPRAECSDASAGMQVGKMVLEIELFFIVRAPSSMAAPAQLREQAFAHYSITRKVYRTLQGFFGKHSSELTRASTYRNREYYPCGMKLLFECSIKDVMTVAAKIKVTPQAGIHIDMAGISEQRRLGLHREFQLAKFPTDRNAQVVVKGWNGNKKAGVNDMVVNPFLNNATTGIFQRNTLNLADTFQLTLLTIAHITKIKAFT